MSAKKCIEAIWSEPGIRICVELEGPEEFVEPTAKDYHAAMSDGGGGRMPAPDHVRTFDAPREDQQAGLSECRAITLASAIINAWQYDCAECVAGGPKLLDAHHHVLKHGIAAELRRVSRQAVAGPPLNPQSPEQWSASLDEEDGYIPPQPSRESAIARIIADHDLAEGDTIHLGPIRRPEFGDISASRADHQLEDILESSGMEWPEAVHDSIGSRCTAAAKKDFGSRLNHLLKQWAAEHGIFGISFIVDGEPHTITFAEASAFAKAEGGEA